MSAVTVVVPPRHPDVPVQDSILQLPLVFQERRMAMTERKILFGAQSFRKLREKNKVYIDKTGFIVSAQRVRI